MVLLGGKPARGGLWESVWKKIWAKNGRDRLGFQNFPKNASNFQLFLNQLLSDLDENLYTHSS